MNTCLAHYVDHQGRCNDCHELRALKAELSVARERLGPAGYKIIHEVASLKAEVERWKAAHAEIQRQKGDSALASMVLNESIKADLNRERERSEKLAAALESISYFDAPKAGSMKYWLSSAKASLAEIIATDTRMARKALLAAKQDDAPKPPEDEL